MVIIKQVIGHAQVIGVNCATFGIAGGPIGDMDGVYGFGYGCGGLVSGHGSILSEGPPTAAGRLAQSQS